MTPTQIEIITALSKCRFIPGSWDKKFIRDMSFKDQKVELTEHQNEWLYRLLYKYRRQAPRIYKHYHKHPLCCKKLPRPQNSAPAPPPSHPVVPPAKEPKITGTQTNLNI